MKIDKFLPYLEIDMFCRQVRRRHEAQERRLAREKEAEQRRKQAEAEVRAREVAEEKERERLKEAKRLEREKERYVLRSMRPVVKCSDAPVLFEQEGKTSRR